MEGKERKLIFCQESSSFFSRFSGTAWHSIGHKSRCFAFLYFFQLPALPCFDNRRSLKIRKPYWPVAAAVLARPDKMWKGLPRGTWWEPITRSSSYFLAFWVSFLANAMSTNSSVFAAFPQRSVSSKRIGRRTEEALDSLRVPLGLRPFSGFNTEGRLVREQH